MATKQFLWRVHDVVRQSRKVYMYCSCWADCSAIGTSVLLSREKYMYRSDYKKKKV